MPDLLRHLMMPPRGRAWPSAARAALLACAVLAPGLLAGCDWNRSPAPTTTPTATPTATATTTAQSARGVDFSDPAVTDPIIEHFAGGQIPPARVAYADLTGDGVEEAVAIVESGGTAGDLGAAVLGMAEGRPRLLGYIDHAGRVEVRLTGPVAGVIAVTQGVYAPADARCCPSRLREIVEQWDGERFAVVTDQVIDNPRP